MRSSNLPVLVRATNVLKSQASLVPVPASVVVSHHAGRDSQEGIFGELKSQCHLDCIPVKTRCGNAARLLAGFQYNA